MVIPTNSYFSDKYNRYYVDNLNEDTDEINIKSELKNIAKNLGYTYIETNEIDKSNIIGRGTINVGNVIINIRYNKVINYIIITLKDSIKEKGLNCTQDVSELNKLSVDLQTASMIIKSIQESNLMD